jgi:cystathionine gamma-synthase
MPPFDIEATSPHGTAGIGQPPAGAHRATGAPWQPPESGPGDHPRSCAPATRAVRAAIDTDPQHGAVVPPLHLSSTFSFDGLGGKRRYDYTRSGNPTRDQLGEALASLEEGAGAVVTSSGMAAVTTVLQLLRPDDLLVIPHDPYGGSFRLFHALANKGAFRLEAVDQTVPGGLEGAAALRPRMIWVETPSNPLLRITDLTAAARTARGCGALLVVDNTFLSPALQRPIPLGADLVVHSTTKYLNGHSDVVGGAVVSRSPELHEEVAWWANCLGVTGSPFDSFLTLRGVRTLHARIRVHQENALALVERLLSHPAVGVVHHPSIPTHPGYDVAARQQEGPGAMISFTLRGGLPAIHAFVEGLECMTLAESLGGVESLVAHPASMTHASMTPEGRRQAGIGDDLLRISVGIEDGRDLLADLERALDRGARAAGERGTGAAETTFPGPPGIRQVAAD